MSQVPPVKAQRARDNRAIVRKLLRQRQPEFAAALASTEHYFSCPCDVVAADGSAVIIGQNQQRVDDTRLATLTTLAKAGQASWCSGEDWTQGGA